MFPRYVMFFISSTVLYVLSVDIFLDIPSDDFVEISIGIPLIAVCLLKITQKMWFKLGRANKEGEYKPTIRFLPLIVILGTSPIFLLAGIVIPDQGFADFFNWILTFRFVQTVFKFSLPSFFAFFIVPLIVKWFTTANNKQISLWANAFLNKYFFYAGALFTEFSITRNLREKDLFSPEILEQILPGIPHNRTVVISDLRSRSQKLQLINGIILGFIVIVLIVAAIFIVFAGEIASKDTQSISFLQTMLSSRTQINNELVKLEREKADKNIQYVTIKRKIFSLKNKIEQLKGAQNSDKRSKVQSEIDNVENDLFKIEADTGLLDSRIKRKSDDLERTESILSDLKTKSIDTGVTKLDPITGVNLLIAAGITRFGVLAITIYLVQILLNLYRYNVRVSGFYLSRADALTIMDHPAKKISDISKNLAPAVDFGKEPTTLLEKFSEKLGALIDKSVTEALKMKDKKKDVV
jgi:hypothetical protein